MVGYVDHRSRANPFCATSCPHGLAALRWMDRHSLVVGAFAGAIIAAPWLPYRFSLRTLLIAMTLVAVGLGVYVWAAT